MQNCFNKNVYTLNVGVNVYKGTHKAVEKPFFRIIIIFLITVGLGKKSFH